MLLALLAAAAVGSAPSPLETQVRAWGKAQIGRAQAVSQECAADLGRTGAQSVLQPAAVSNDPTFENERTAVRNGRTALRTCETRLLAIMGPAHDELAKLHLPKADQEKIFASFETAAMKAARSDEAQLIAYLDSIDAILVHLQTSHAAWDPAKNILAFPNPADLQKFQAMVAQMQATAQQLVADAHAHQAAAKAATQ